MMSSFDKGKAFEQKGQLWRDSPGGEAFLALAQRYKCGQCRKKFDKPWVVATGKPWPDNVQPNVEIAFHWADTHGFPEDMFYELVMSAMFDRENYEKIIRNVGHVDQQ